MIDYMSIIKENPAGVLATRDGDRVRTRYVSVFYTEGNRLYFTTGSEKPLCDQLKKNPNASFCTHAQSYNPVLTVEGKVTFVDDMGIKTRFMEEYPSIRGHYGTPESPGYQLFYLEAAETSVFYPAEGKTTYQVKESLC